MNAMIQTTLQSATPLFTWLGEWLTACLLGGTTLALVTWLVVKLAGKRLPTSLVFTLWLIVLVKFLAPIGPGWSYSLATLTSKAHTELTPAVESLHARPSTPADGEIVNFVPLQTGTNVGTSVPQASNNLLGTWPQWLLAGYLVGVAFFAIRRVIMNARLQREIDALPAASPNLFNMVASVCERHGVGVAPRVKLSEAAPAPFILGYLRPTLVLSPRQLADRAELEAVVLHEIAHLRRADWLARCLQQLVGTLLFFWPVVAWVNRRIDLAREQSCDEWALRHGRLSAGQYARCLLRAVQPVSAAARSACPTAMAANARHVERRIEMILEKTPSRRPSRLVGLLAGGAVLGWAGFVLAGPQQEKKVVVQCDDSNGAKKAVVIVNSNDNGVTSTQDHMVFLTPDGGPIMLGGEGEGDFVFITSDDGDAGAGMSRSMIALHGQGAKSLAQFGKDHPSADANGDGQVSQSEYNAYVTALALLDPAKVLAQYPDADRNGDGKLDAVEAARLIMAPPKMPAMFAKMIPDGGKAGGTIVTTGDAGAANVEVNVTASGNEPEKHVVVIRKTDANGNTTEQTLTGADAEAQGVPILSKVPVIGTTFQEKLSMPASKWILTNVDGAPIAAVVAKLVPVVDGTSLATFLEQNPKADRNGDGVLTAAERDAYVAENMSVMRQKFLDKNPAADTNGDGVLSAEEMHAFLMSGKMAGLHSKLQHNVQVENGKVIVDGKEVSPEDGNVKVIRVQKSGNGEN